jgi:dihydrofolate reductase
MPVDSRTLEAISTARTRLERESDADAIRRIKGSATRNMSVGGPGLAAHALRAGLVDECHLFLTPVVVGGGPPWLPTGLRLDLELLDERRFASGVVHLHYRTRS